ncbi:Chondroitin sulfate ABC exolyase [Pontiella sulfatireligans]|uniref:Chondroitin sulfate ABC exolyase n=2 Tax=Pontiella sulfatireligans TaxID=2750658 RepID=A0A6C2UGN0_9BACT|nr:Chondroitin sulfate ABC exolyase [Pontiella sulfatireligans]
MNKNNRSTARFVRCKVVVISALFSMPFTGHAIDGVLTDLQPQPNFKTYTFDQAIEPDFTAHEDSVLSRNGKVLHGASGKSLQWDWSKSGASFQYRNNQAFKNLKGEQERNVAKWDVSHWLSTFSLWVYNETASDEKLWFSIGDGTSEDARFYMLLNFTGWRELKALYGRDIPGFPNQKTADTLTVFSPEGNHSGTLYFDDFCPRMEVEERFVGPTDYSPWVATEYITRRAQRDPLPVPESITDAQMADMKMITGRLESLYTRKIKPRKISTEKMDELRALYTRWNISRNGTQIDGLDIVYAAMAQFENGLAVKYYPASFWKKNVTPIMEAYQAASDEDMKAELKGMLDGLVDLWLQQSKGFKDRGVARDNFVWPILAYQDELKASGRYGELVASVQKVAVDVSFLDVYPYAQGSVYTASIAASLYPVLLKENSPEKWIELLEFKRWAEHVVHHAEFKPDGTLHHHRQHYSGYSIPSLGAATRLVQLFSNTSLALEETHKQVRRALEVVHFYIINNHGPRAFAGRHPRQRTNLSPSFLNMAKSGDPYTGESIDREMAANFLYHAQRNKPRKAYAPFVKKYTEMGVTAAETPSGHLTLNHSVAALHRRDDWMAVVRGANQYYVGTEIYGFQQNNSMGRNVFNGMLNVISSGNPVNPDDSGFILDRGWNWNYWPGTTVRDLPFDALAAHFLVEEYYADEYFAGGTSLGANGVFALKFHEIPPTRVAPPKRWFEPKDYQQRIKDAMFDESHHARKSYAFFDDLIVALGSGIKNQDKDHRTVTVLFQNHLNDDVVNDFVLADTSKTFPLDKTLGAENAWFVDSQRIGYYVPSDNDEVQLSRGEKSSPFYPSPRVNTIVEGRGPMEWGVIDHGKAPKESGYEYAMLINADESKMKDFSVRPPYEVLQNDQDAHVVRHAESRTTSYVLFENADKVDAGPLYGASKPCILMIQEVGEDRIKISLVDPDLGESIGKGDDTYVANKHYVIGTKVTLSLNGRWWSNIFHPQAGEAYADMVDEECYVTKVEFHCKQGLPVEIELKRKEKI